MARARADISTTDILDTDEEPVLDFMTLRTGAPLIEPISQREFADLAEYEKWMQEPMVVRIPQPTDPNAPWSVAVGSNGAYGWLPYDKKVRIKRAFVENLVRAVESSIHTADNPDAASDQRKIHRRRHGSSYPFEVIDHGARPDLSRKWMQRLVAESRR